MKNLSSNSMFRIFFILALLVVLAKTVALVALWFLPATTINMPHNRLQTNSFYRADFHNVISPLNHASIEKKTVQMAMSMQDFILHGLYGTSTEGYVIIASKMAPNKTEIIGIGERYKGFRLHSIFLNYVVFVKNGKKYILHLQGNMSKKAVPVLPNNSAQNSDGVIDVKRSDINYYSKNIAQIWRDISLQELGKNGDLQGFKVAKIRPNSKIAHLGLRKGDIIIKVNGKVLKSYNDVLKIYQDLHKLNAINLLIKRGNIQKEIYYEIN